LSLFTGVRFSKFPESASAILDDLLASMSFAWAALPFDEIFLRLYDYYVMPVAIPSSHFTILPQFLTFLAQSDGLTPTNKAGRLSSLIEILLTSQATQISPTTIGFLCDAIHPFLYQLNHLALRLFIGMKPCLHKDELEVFANDLPLIMSPLIEMQGPYLPTPERVSVEQFDPPRAGDHSVVY
jgi:hypothetical protein